MKSFLITFEDGETTRWVEHDLALEHHLELLGQSLARVCSRGPLPKVTAKVLSAGAVPAERRDAAVLKESVADSGTASLNQSRLVGGADASSLPTPTPAGGVFFVPPAREISDASAGGMTSATKGIAEVDA